MAFSIPDDKIQEIRDRSDIVDLIGDYVPLKKRGKNYLGLCPFHQEKTPSFNVSPERQIFHCFGCGKGGDVFRFLMDHEHLNFVEAVQFLAKRYGIALPQRSEKPGTTQISEKLYQANETAATFFETNLARAPQSVQEYLQKRHLQPETIKIFRLGYAADSWDALIKTGPPISTETLQQAGLIGKSEQRGTFYDLFRHRLMFPIFHHNGNIVGFGGRALDPQERAKYINTPESPVYHKSDLLYGLYQAKREIRPEKTAILVEGYLDVIALHQADIRLAVAPLGTALTAQQAKLLKRYASQIIIAFDGDPAGQKAALRAIPLLLAEKLDVRIIVFPYEDDPDTFIHREGTAAFRRQMTDSQPFFDYVLTALSQEHDLKTVNGKAAIAREMMSYLEQVKDPIQLALYRTKLADYLNINEQTIVKLIPKDLKQASQPTRYQRIESRLEKAERGLLFCFLESVELRSMIKTVLSPEDFVHSIHRRVAPLLWEMDMIEGFAAGKELLALIEDEQSRSAISEILMCDSMLSLNRDNVKHWINILKTEQLQAKKLEMERLLSLGKGDEVVLLGQIADLKKEMLQFSVKNIKNP